MRAAVAGAVELVLSAERREHRKLAVHGNNRQTIPRYALVWIPADGALYAASEPQMRPSQGPSIDASDVFGANLPDTKHEQDPPQHQIYPYLLRKLTIGRPNQVWCVDITYIPMQRGFLYLVAIMDLYSRKVLSWRLSNSMEADFCVEALKEAIAKYGKPEIMNSDQGSQFTGFEWTQALKDAGIQISMDGKGRWIDNRMIERLWRSLKYECIYLNAFETGSEARTGIGKWLAYYNTKRPHSTHGILTPDEAYERKTVPMSLVA